MQLKINRILIPCLVIIILGLGNHDLTVGQAPNQAFYLPIVSDDPTSWIGPYGGTIIPIAIDPTNPQVMYVGTFGSGVFKSADGGNNWHSINNGLGNLFIYSLAIDPTHPNNLYAGTYRGPIYRSDDGGGTWIWSSTGIQDQAVTYSLVVDPRTSTNVYASTRGASTNGDAPWNGVVYRSVDAGHTWTPSMQNMAGVKVQDWVYSLAINPNSPNQVFAATHQSSPYRSDDYGVTWNSIDNGVDDPSGRAIVISPQEASSSTLYLGVWHFASVYKTLVSGDLWTLKNHNITEVKVYSMAIDPFSAESVYMGTFSHGILKTVDGGDNWQSTGLQNDQVYTVAINPQTTSVLFSSTSGDGLYRSQDYASSWQRSNKGINNANVTAVVNSPTITNTLFASTYGAGVYRSPNRGQNWFEMNYGLGDNLVHDIVIDPAHPELLYALTNSSGLFQFDLNTNNGWVSIGGELPLTMTPKPSYPPDHPFATLDMKEAFATPQETLSVDQAIYSSLLTMEFAPSDPMIAYMGMGGAGVYRSSDGGINWLPAEMGGQTVTSLAIDKTDPNLVYATTNAWGGMKLSTDGGVSWRKADLPVNFYALAASPSEAGVLYAGTSDGLYRYQEDTDKWSSIGLVGQSITALLFDSTRPGLIYAGTTSGAYYSKDNGLTWTLVDRLLIGHTIQSISFANSEPDEVFFSTTTHGILLKAFHPR